MKPAKQLKLSLPDYIDSLKKKIETSYTEGVTMDEAEKLAGEFLYAQMLIASALKIQDLDARMHKSGIKAVRAKAYLDIVSSADKKPTEAQIAAIIDTDEIVITEQTSLDNAEVRRLDLERYYDIFLNAHIFFRGIAKGKFSE